MKLLIIEDSDTLRRSIVIGLSNLGFTIEEASDGQTGLDIALHNQYDLIILDIMLPSIDGLSILDRLRSSNNDVKILILSAKNQPDDRVKGLLQGADDYLSKPFVFDELHARILALLRREANYRCDDNIRLDKFSLNILKREFLYKDTIINLTISEYKIVEYFLLNLNKVIDIDSLTSAIAGNFDYVSKNTIHVHISAIRKKVREYGGELPLKHKRGYGYILEGTHN